MRAGGRGAGRPRLSTALAMLAVAAAVVALAVVELDVGIALALGVLASGLVLVRGRGRLVDAQGALRRSEDRHRSVIETAPDAILTVDADGRIESVNPAAERLFGHTAEAMVGQDVAMLAPVAPGPAPSSGGRSPDDDLVGALRGLRGDTDGEGRRVTARRRDGSDISVRLSVGATTIDGRPGVTAVMHDESGLVEAERRTARLAREQESLARIAMEVASSRPPHHLFPLIASEVAGSLGTDIAIVGRYRGGNFEMLGVCGAAPGIVAGTLLPLQSEGLLGSVAREGRPQQVEDLSAMGPAGVLHAAAGDRVLRGAAAAPVIVGGELWGAVAVGSGSESLPPEVVTRTQDFARLVTTALSEAEARSRLVEQAVTDSLTGLANQRAFWDRLGGECERAARHGRDLAVVLIDIDGFKHINDTQGHRAGDRAIAEVARRLATLTRSGDMLARIGGDEFGWIIPEASALGGYQAAERARAITLARPVDGAGPLTVSAGVCDTTHARGAEELFRLADGALYWAKAQGRNATYVYSPEVVRELSEQARVTRLAREQALAGLRALARAVDAKDSDTRRHSQRVAELSVALAEHMGWEPARVAQLHEAALLHDVGKIGVPDAVLFKPSSLTAQEFDLVKEHAPLGAEIAAEVLDAEQVEWIRHHHERCDGSGYPDGLRGDAIPMGAQILAVADSWDVMTSVRTYKVALSAPQAMHEVRRCRGTQFAPAVVTALEWLHDARRLEGGLTAPAVRELG